MRLITYDTALVPNDGFEVYASVCAYHKAAGKDAAGSAFHRFALLQAGLLVETDDEEDKASAFGDENNSEAAAAEPGLNDDKNAEGVRWKHRKKDRKGKKKEEKRVDLYALLGLEDTRWLATDAQVRKAYQKQALKHHPDKATAGITDEAEKAKIETKFKQILEAFETLSDPGKRREYDSTDTFDDSLPESCKPEDFYAVFGAAFRRQARWSEAKPVPDLGGADADYKAVQKFYDFWMSFRSWREFPHEDEEDPECAEFREERRWIERENARLRKVAKKEEVKRIRDFVERAYLADPRIAAQKEAVKAEKERKKRERQEEREKKEAEAAAAAAAAAETAAAAEAAAKETAERERKAKQVEQRELRKQRKRLRDLTSDVSFDGDPLLSYDDCEDLCRELNRSQLCDACAALEAAGGEEAAMRRAVEAALQTMYAVKGEEYQRRHQAKAAAAAEAREKRKAALKDKVQAAREWDEEEVRMLDKALVKFPVGVPRRWEQVTAYIRTRTQDEVLFMVKVKQGAHASKVEKPDWRAGRKGGLQADVSISSAADDRASAFTDVEVRSDATNGATAASDGAANGARQNGATAAGEAADASSATNGSVPAAAAAAAAAPEDDWSKAQELALIKAMKAIGKDVTDRWDRIAELVEGKSALDCRKRFQALKARARPAAAAS